MHTIQTTLKRGNLMALWRFYSQKSEDEDFSKKLPSELWYLICHKLEPVFLNSFLRTCHLFSTFTQQNSIFKLLLEEQYPDSLPTAPAIPAGLPYTLFRNRYRKDTKGLSFAARALWDLCFYANKETIASFIERTAFSPDMLSEADTNGTFILSYVNRLDDQRLRDQIFAKVKNWFTKEAYAESWWKATPLSFIYHSPEEEIVYKFKTSNGFVLMDFAVALNQLDFVKQNKKFLTQDTTPNKLKLGFFSSACMFGHLDIIKYMLTHYTSSSIWNSSSYSEEPLSSAVKGNQTEVVEFLLLTHRSMISLIRFNCAATLAIKDSHLAILELMFDGLRTNMLLLDEFLQKACKDAQPKTAKLIVQHFPELLNDGVDEFLTCSAKSGCTELLVFFFSYIENIPQYLTDNLLLIDAAVSGNVTAVNYLLDMGAPINEADDEGDTALHAAALNGEFEVVKTLVEHSANLALSNVAQQTPLQIAKTLDDTAIAMYLMEEQFQRGKKRRADIDLEEGKRPHKRPRR